MRPFYLALNLAGTVSAGAYSAGVLDFFIEAMDAWYDERENQKALFGEDFSRWTIPPHETHLAVLSGASGGGIAAALAAAALSQPFRAVHHQSPGGPGPWNNLFQSWVADIDLKDLCRHDDLDKSAGHVVSLLDSTVIRAIAEKTLRISQPIAARRSWVLDPLRVILTLTNLGGVPYALEPQTDAKSARTLYYADVREFDVSWIGHPGTTSGPVQVAAHGGDGWDQLANAAIATGAFPIVLAPQLLERTAGEYNNRLWRISQENPKCGPDGICRCERLEPMPPTWNVNDETPVRSLNVDGGATNNSPFDLAWLRLESLTPTIPAAIDRSDPSVADRMVVSIAPLQTDVEPGLQPLPDTRLVSLLGRIIQVILTQSRIQGENLKFTSDPNVASRWVIAPTQDMPGVAPIAGSMLGAFGGFLSRTFREYDYQLGRRNCQRFLTAYFGVPWDNQLIRAYGLSEEALRRVDAEFGFLNETGDRRLVPLIPVMKRLRTAIPAERRKIASTELEATTGAILDRVKKVTEAAIAEAGLGGLWNAAFQAIWFFNKGTLKNFVRERIRSELVKNQFA